MKNRLVVLLALLLASTTLASINNLQILSLQSSPDIDQVENTFLLNGQEITVLFQQDFDGLRLILDGKGQSLIFDSFDFIEDIKQPIKSISIVNSPRSNITGRNTPITLVNSHNSTIANNTIADITNSSSYAYGIMLINSPDSVIYNNTIFNLTSTINSASGIHLVDSEYTTIRNNTIEIIASTSTGFFDPRDTYGVLINSSSFVQVFDTRIENLDSNGRGYGIFVESSPFIEINDSFIDDINSSSSQGICIVNSQNTFMKNNTITNIISSTQVSSGISLKDSSSSSIILNNITTIDAWLTLNGIYLDNSEDSIVGNNTIESLHSSYSILYGIGLKESERTDIEWNNISNLNSPNSEAIGIFAEESEDLKVKNNTITNVTSSFGLYFINIDDLIISWNNLTNVQNWIYIDEKSSNVLYSHNIVDGQNITLESFSRPADLVILEGDTTKSISWVASDPKADDYTIYKDGVLIDNGTWINGVQIDHSLDYSLTVGVTHSYHIVLTESTGFNITDYVDVTVSEGDLPQLVDIPVDQYIGLESTNQVLSWTLTDSHPGNYTIYLNKSILDIFPNSWTSSSPINYNISNDIHFLGVYNYTIIADDTSGNSVKDTVFVFVLNTTDVSITAIPSIHYRYGATGHALNWTVISAEGGTYTIYKVNGTTKTEKDTGAFEPGEFSILYIVDGLSIGTHNYTIVVKSEGRPPIEDYIIVKVREAEFEDVQDTKDVTLQQHSIPPYLTRPPPNPWPPIIMGGFLVAASCIAAYWYVTRRLMVPSSVKIEKKAIKKARQVKDIHEEGKRLGAIGRVYFEAGSYKKAIKSHKQALAIFKKTGDKKAQIKELESLGNAYLAQGVEEKHD